MAERSAKENGQSKGGDRRQKTAKKESHRENNCVRNMRGTGKVAGEVVWKRGKKRWGIGDVQD